MKSKKKILAISFLFISLISFSQQIGDGNAPIINDFTILLQSGVYNGHNSTGATPDNSYDGWQHLFVMRHGNPENNHQLQIASSFFTNDRLFFRKISGVLPSQNPDWFELATRGGNTFNGNQIINGNLGIGTSAPEVKLDVLSTSVAAFFRSSTNVVPVSIINSGSTISTVGFKGSTTSSEYHVRVGADGNDFIAYTGNVEKMRLTSNGNLGIGTTTPDEKLTVNGTIHATEVKVTQTVPADYVFQKYYTGKSELKSDYVMPTLAEIESFSKKNHHLPNVPSAQEVQQNGVSLGTMSNVLLQKVEELTLYAIEQQKKLDEQNKIMETQSKILEALTTRLNSLEKK